MTGTTVAYFVAIAALALCCLAVVEAGTKSTPHPHKSILPQFDGKHISYRITQQQEATLGAGQPVTVNERLGSHGRGIVIQDVAALPYVCLDRISDLANYYKMVPKVKKVEVYETNKYENGTTKLGAAFEVGVSLVSFSYYLLLSHDPAYQTFTWTLDYRYHSDFDDSVGHWQVMPHPVKDGWSRVLYSAAVQLPPWVPEFVLTFLTKSALVEATSWVRKESEKVTASPKLLQAVPYVAVPDVRACFVLDEAKGEHSYDTQCADAVVASANTTATRRVQGPATSVHSGGTRQEL